jgi:GNAT superfamily N-acetyltransferase
MATTTLTISTLDPADPAAVEGAYLVRAAAVANDIPDFPQPSRFQFEAEQRVPWPGEDLLYWIARVDGGEIVGQLKIALPTLDNLENAFVEATVRPDHRRRGIGRALFDHAVAFVRERGRKRIMAMTPDRLPGGAPRDPGPSAFAAAVGMRNALDDVRRRLDLATVDWAVLDAMLAEARAASAGYSLVRWRNVVPEEYIADVARLDSDFLNEAPLGDLVLEAENIDATRIRAAEAARAQHGRTLISTVAVHDSTATVVAMSDIARQAGHVEHAGQGITLVNPAHRGHRLGLLTKIENLRYAIDELPGMRYIDTWNAAVNAHMIAINERMGFRAVDAWPNWQLEI